MVLVERFKIWIRVLRAYLKTFTGVKCDVLDPGETVKLILGGKSLIRFGDGEFGIYKEKDIHYQPYSCELKQEFENIKQEFEEEGAQCRYLLAVPKRYMQCSGLELGKKRVLVSSWSESRLYFKNNFKLNLTYGDSFLFEKKNKEIYSRIWSNPHDNRIIIFVHNNRKYADYFAKTYNKEVIYVGCKPYDAFSDIELLHQSIISQIEDRKLSSKDVQIVISAGPAGKVLVKDLSNIGYQCIDAGHCWDDPLES